LHIAGSRRRKAAFFFPASFFPTPCIAPDSHKDEEHKIEGNRPKKVGDIPSLELASECLENVYSPSLYLKNHRDLGMGNMLPVVHDSQKFGRQIISGNGLLHLVQLKL